MRRGLRGMLRPVRSRAVQLRWLYNAEHGLLDSRQVANHFGVHNKTVQRWVREGRLRDYRTTDEQFWFYPDDVGDLLTPLR